MKPFPWIEAMQFGFGMLRLSSDTFWRLTPRELAHAIAAVRGPVQPAIDRDGLADLMRRFPDRMGERHE